MEKVELLAPAGDLNRAKTAIRFGADAIYLGGKRFSLRSRASNFGIEDIKEACDFAKKYNARVFVTVNMIPHDEDLEGLKEYLVTLEEVGVQAIICASLYIGKIARKYTKKMEVHLSTQLSITNSTALKYFDDIKPERAVLARECDLKDIKEIIENTDIEIETFIHGGMCVNYSGRCTLSNAMTLRDANRGGCAQSCRWKYHLYLDNEKISDDNILFSMSSKDLMSVEYIYDLINIGVKSLKIEGRMKSEYYIATVVKTYRKLIDEIYESKKRLDIDRINYYKNEISKAENRLTASGFYGEFPSFKHQLYGINGSGVTHDFVGLIVGFDNEYTIIQLRNVININDRLEVFGPNSDNLNFSVLEILDDENNILEKANKPMSLIKLKIPYKVYEMDMVRRV